MWCDVDFVKGGVMSAKDIVSAVGRVLRKYPTRVGYNHVEWILITGGEPALQLDTILMHALRREGWRVIIETNGTLKNQALEMADWLTVSPKLGVPLAVDAANEIIVTVPHNTTQWTTEKLQSIGSLYWQYRYVMPVDPLLSTGETLLTMSGVNEDTAEEHLEEYEMARLAYERTVKACIRFVNNNPEWRITTQLTKHLGYT
jgi:organic radical activating enzyme